MHQNLPAELSTFVGREQPVAEVRRLLSTTRLLTLIGAGGVGKTRLALRVAADAATNYTDGAWLVDLAPVAEAAAVPKVVSSALRLQEQPGRPVVDTLVESLRGRHLLIVVDNCEHLIRSCGDLIELALRACPHLGVLATSRQALRLPGETLYWVPSLEVPEPAPALPEQIVTTEAVHLFVERARAVLPGFALTDTNATAVAQICRQLDGIPLALELAAARLSALSVEQIAARLDDRFKLLTEGSPTALPRQQTLRGTLDWSHDLLSEPERVLLRRLAVFAGGWTLEAAETVCSGNGIEPGDVLDLLSQLVGKSLVMAHTNEEAARYRMLETVRQYATEKLRVAGEAEHLGRSHEEWCLALSNEAEPHLYRGEQLRWLDRLEREHDNIRAALAWSHARGESIALARLARALWWFWYMHGHFDEGRRWLEQAATLIEESTLRAEVLLGAGWLTYGAGELERASGLLQQSLILARACGDRRTAAHAMLALSFTLRDRGQRERSKPLLEESLALSRETGFEWGAGFALYLLSVEAVHHRDDEVAADLLGQSLTIFRDLGERLGLAYTLHDLGRLALEQRGDDRASEFYREGLTLSRQLGNRRGVCFALDGLARGAYRRGDLARATALLRETLVIWQGLGNRWYQASTLLALAILAAEQHQLVPAARLFGAVDAQVEVLGASVSHMARPDLVYEEGVASARKELGEAAFAVAWATGRALTFDQAIMEALSLPSSARANTTGPETTNAALTALSLREREVAILVARGQSNREIAEALVIAPRTADTHVGHILNKLGLHSRAQIAAWVVEQGVRTVDAG